MSSNRNRLSSSHRVFILRLSSDASFPTQKQSTLGFTDNARKRLIWLENLFRLHCLHTLNLKERNSQLCQRFEDEWFMHHKSSASHHQAKKHTHSQSAKSVQLQIRRSRKNDLTVFMFIRCFVFFYLSCAFALHLFFSSKSANQIDKNLIKTTNNNEIYVNHKHRFILQRIEKREYTSGKGTYIEVI